jgi:hypothetical protein
VNEHRLLVEANDSVSITLLAAAKHMTGTFKSFDRTGRLVVDNPRRFAVPPLPRVQRHQRPAGPLLLVVSTTELSLLLHRPIAAGEGTEFSVGIHTIIIGKRSLASGEKTPGVSIS